jgi:hypothetical protein
VVRLEGDEVCAVHATVFHLPCPKEHTVSRAPVISLVGVYERAKRQETHEDSPDDEPLQRGRPRA